MMYDIYFHMHIFYVILFHIHNQSILLCVYHPCKYQNVHLYLLVHILPQKIDPWGTFFDRIVPPYYDIFHIHTIQPYLPCRLSPSTSSIDTVWPSICRLSPVHCVIALTMPVPVPAHVLCLTITTAQRCSTIL